MPRLTEKTLAALVEAGLDHVQISIQDSDIASAEQAISKYDSKCRPVLVSKATDFFDSLNNAPDFAVNPQKLPRGHA